jgi:serine/threonine-protein kinase RsbW
MASVELEIPSRSVYVGVVRLAVASLARQSGLDEERVEDLKIAVSEACSNALLVGKEDGAASSICIRWNDDGGRVVVEVEDRESSTYDSETPKEPGEAEQRLDLSIGLLRSLVDECDILPRDGGGTLTRLIVAG